MIDIDRTNSCYKALVNFLNRQDDLFSSAKSENAPRKIQFEKKNC